MIIGQRFLKHFELDIECAQQRLHFPDALPYCSDWKSDIILSREDIRPKLVNPAAQYAMEQHDQRCTATQNERPTIANVQILSHPCTNT